MPDADTQSLDDLGALEQFVAENDELLELEEHLGRFNVFDALRATRAELHHSNFLSWLLDPSASHGQGDLFLKAILMDLFKQARAAGAAVPLTAVDLDSADLSDADVRREHRRIDVLVICKEHGFVLAIENKVDASEHSDQLQRYRRIIESELTGLRPLLVYLTAGGDEPTDEAWNIYTHRDLHRVLTRVRRTARGSLGGDVGVFLDHYLNLVENQFMDNEAIEALCHKIYRNHRRAIDLIIEKVQPGTPSLLGPVAESIDQMEGGPWYFRRRTTSELLFLPKPWLEALPPIASDSEDPRAWLAFNIYISADNRAVRVTLLVCPTADQELRKSLILRLTQDGNEFGLSRNRKKISERWTRLASVSPYKWKEDEEPDQDACWKSVMDAFRQLFSKLPEVRPLLVQMFKSHINEP